MVKPSTGLGIIITGFLFLFLTFQVSAQVLQSTNYRFVETSLGGSGLQNAASSNFQSTATSGVIGLGTSASSSFQVKGGHQTTGDPTLTLIVSGSAASFGDFSPATAATATGQFQVINYTSYGYVVQVIGNAPTFNSHTISSMSSTGPSQVGVEQFGVNLVANTSPVSVGSNPDNGGFGYGAAATNYDTPNNYRYVSGETIALAPKSSGNTIYTISYLVNVTSHTPAGPYTANQTIICTGTY